MTDPINPGDIVRVRTDPPFSDEDGLATDPTTVRLLWRRKREPETVWVFGVDSEIVHDGAGTFHADILVEGPGVHYFRWEGDGVVTAAAESTFTARSYFGMLGS